MHSTYCIATLPLFDEHVQKESIRMRSVVLRHVDLARFKFEASYGFEYSDSGA